MQALDPPGQRRAGGTGPEQGAGAEHLHQQPVRLNGKLGPEYLALTAGLKGVDPKSSDAQEINLILEELDESCGDLQQRLVLAAIREVRETNKSPLLACLGCQTKSLWANFTVGTWQSFCVVRHFLQSRIAVEW